MPTSPHVRIGLLSDDLTFGDEVLEQVLAAETSDTLDTRSAGTTRQDTPLHSGHTDPIPPELEADIRALDRLLAKMMHRASATIARSHLYFSDENLRALGDPAEATDVADEIELKARSLLLRAEAPHTQKYMAWSAQLRAAALAAGRAAHLFDLLQRDQTLTPLLAPLRRVADAAQRVLLYTATTLETAETRSLASVVRYQAEMAEACTRAMEALGRTQALQPLPTERITRAAIWSLVITAECAAIVAQQYTEVQVERRVREAHRAHTAAKYSAAAARQALTLLQEDGWSLDAHPLPIGDLASESHAAEKIAVLRPTPPPSAIPSPTPLMRRVAPPRRADNTPADNTPESRRSHSGTPTERERAANAKVRRGLAAVARLFTR